MPVKPYEKMPVKPYEKMTIDELYTTKREIEREILNLFITSDCAPFYKSKGLRVAYINVLNIISEFMDDGEGIY